MSTLVSNPFDDNDFTTAVLTEAINVVPNTYGEIRQEGIFQMDTTNTQRVVGIDIVNGVLRVLRSKPVGADADFAGRGERETKYFAIPHFPLEDKIYAADLQGMRKPGGFESEDLSNFMYGRLSEMKDSYAITEEYLYMGALQGLVKDGAGKTLLNIFETFGVTQKTFDFDLDNGDAEVEETCSNVVSHMDKNMAGDVRNGINCRCDKIFMDKLIHHPSVEKFFLNHVAALNMVQSSDDPRKGFKFGGINFIQYEAEAPSHNGEGNIKFIADGTAHFYPVGTKKTFRAIPCPADSLDQVNMPGQLVYAFQSMERKRRFIDLISEMNLLAVCYRPALLPKGTA